jgi:site-specific DNA recombinase
MKCVAYCRVSKDTTDQLNSLDNQINHYTELFKKESYQGAEVGMYYAKEGKKEIIDYISSIFADEGISGTKLKNREAFKYMLECAYRKEFDIIYVKNVQRWARSVSDGSDILKKLKVMGVKVIFEDGNLNNFEHEMTINILLSTAQEESRAKSAAVQFGIRKAQEKGKFTATPPYGYIAENGYLKPVPEKLEVVTNIFNWYLDGLGITKIVKELNHLKAPTQKGGKWAKTQIYNILGNQIYTGKQVTHTVVNTDINIDKVTHKDGEKKYEFKQQKPVDEGQWITNYIEDLRVISDEVFNDTQEELNKRKELYGRDCRPSTKHIFSNLLYCRNCGRALRRKKLWGWKRKDGSRNFGVEWCCTNHDNFHNDICQFRNSWREEVLIERIKIEIEKLRSNKDNLDKMFKDYLKLFYSNEEVSEKIKEYEIQIDEIKTEISANLKLFSKNIIDEEQYKQQNDELQINKKSIESELKKLKKIDEARETAKKKYNNYVDFLNTVDVDNLDNTLLKKVINKIEAYTIIDEKGQQLKDIYIVWNMLDKSFDDIFYRSVKPIYI